MEVKLEENTKEKIKKQIDEIENILEDVSEKGALEYAKWMNEKADIKFNRMMPKFPITSNYIYWCNLGVNIGSEQNKIRPVIIIRTQITSPICTVLPLTSERIGDDKWYHIDLEDNNSTAMIEQVRNISKLRVLGQKRINGIAERITQKDLERINIVLGKYYRLQEFPRKKRKKH